jgi:hypothetical protein
LRAATLAHRSGLGAGSPRGGVHKEDFVMRSGSKLSARVPVWIAGISVCLWAASGIVATLRSIPASSAGIPDESAASEHAATSEAAADAYASDPQSDLAGARPTINRRSRASCSECGVVASIREIERLEIPGDQDPLNVKVAGRVSGGAIVAGAMTRKSYEITVRFRDGSSTVFNEAGLRTWRIGSRVIVLGHSIASN